MKLKLFDFRFVAGDYQCCLIETRFASLYCCDCFSVGLCLLGLGQARRRAATSAGRLRLYRVPFDFINVPDLSLML